MIKTIENIFDKDEYLLVKNYIYSLDWKYLDRTDHVMQQSGAGFTHMVWSEESLTHWSDWKNNNSWLMKLIHLKVNKYFKLKDFIRVKANMLLPKDTDHICPPHIDSNLDHWAAVFYFSTEKQGYGETVLYNQTVDTNTLKSPTDIWQIDEELTVNKLVPCKENTGVFFKGDTLHSAAYPKNIMRRLVLNINFVGTPHGNTN